MKKTKIMKTELEEAAKFNYDNKTSRIPVPTSHWINSEFLQIQNFIEGAKWQAEQIPFIIEQYLETAFISKEQGYKNPKDWFKQFKKKA